MPISGNSRNEGSERPYFKSLEQLDLWANVRPLPLDVLPYHPRGAPEASRGKLLVCHDYKGGYTESPFTRSYTFNFWSFCDSFVYFSHHRVTIPPPGWINAAHRQGVKMFGTLIFEPGGGGEADCLRLLVGRLPKSPTGPVLHPVTPPTLPLSPHYARILADLARQRGFDGYLLNFECHLAGSLEQTRALAAWITLLRTELKAKVGDHTEVIWYDSVVVSGQLAWQDRLNSLNLPFFLSSSSIFTNYTWRPHYPGATAEYFLNLDTDKTLQDVYMGIDVWGRGSHGGGGLGSYRALTHIAPDTLGLSVALFGQAWTWESEQDEPGWNWEAWWEYERTLWVGKEGEVEVPESPRREGEPECPHGPFVPVSSFFARKPSPDPRVLPLHTTFSPGIGQSWFVRGVKVLEREKEGWTDVDKQTSLGDMVWPYPALSWEGEQMDDVAVLPDALAKVSFDDAWNGGSALLLTLSDKGSEAALRTIWLPVQSLTLTPGQEYEATAVYKIGDDVQADYDLGLSVNSQTSLTPLQDNDTQLGNGWTKLAVKFSASRDGPASVAVGLIITIISEDPSQALNLPILLGQLNVYPSIPALERSQILWAELEQSSGILSWEIAASLPPVVTLALTSPDDPNPAWEIQSSAAPWFPAFVYFNVYGQIHGADGSGVGSPDKAMFLGTSGYDGMKNRFILRRENLPSSLVGKDRMVRLYVQGVTDRGEVLGWDQCAFTDMRVIEK